MMTNVVLSGFFDLPNIKIPPYYWILYHVITRTTSNCFFDVLDHALWRWTVRAEHALSIYVPTISISLYLVYSVHCLICPRCSLPIGCRSNTSANDIRIASTYHKCCISTPFCTIAMRYIFLLIFRPIAFYVVLYYTTNRLPYYHLEFSHLRLNMEIYLLFIYR